ncbi:hypothetical protein PoB_007208200 [Plakobranchus ocellatus]|uniref:Uncharacterized protein n=1 Tax=Plakobranchus ocellatus TaxID=259542 RepID=A0AAV4DNA1_9GAST|nr:hypothetical protein PoB_007208200 [Plakobranchus ocellatus]
MKRPVRVPLHPFLSHSIDNKIIIMLKSTFYSSALRAVSRSRLRGHGVTLKCPHRKHLLLLFSSRKEDQPIAWHVACRVWGILWPECRLRCDTSVFQCRLPQHCDQQCRERRSARAIPSRCEASGNFRSGRSRKAVRF